MNRTLILFLAVVVLFIPCPQAFASNVFLSRSNGLYGPQFRTGSCKIDPFNRAVTIRNLKRFCNPSQLRNIFSSLSLGPFPVGRLKGYAIVGPDGLAETVWNGKNFFYANGVGRGVGTVTNTLLGIFQFLTASIYRTIAPIDGREAFAIDYRHEIFAFLSIDYLRRVQDNLYLGFVSIRGFETIPVVYFLLESF